MENKNPYRYASAKALTRKAYPFNEKAETTTLEGFVEDPGAIAGDDPAARVAWLFHTVTEMHEPVISDGNVTCPIEKVRFWDDCTLELHYAVNDGVANTGRCLTLDPCNLYHVSGMSNGTEEDVHTVYVNCREAVPYRVCYLLYDSEYAEVEGTPHLNAALTAKRNYRDGEDGSILTQQADFVREWNIRAAATVKSATPK